MISHGCHVVIGMSILNRSGTHYGLSVLILPEWHANV